jgi:hypothetical protein
MFDRENFELTGEDDNNRIEIFYDKFMSDKIKVKIINKKRGSSTTYYFDKMEIKE